MSSCDVCGEATEQEGEALCWVHMAHVLGADARAKHRAAGDAVEQQTAAELGAGLARLVTEPDLASKVREVSEAMAKLRKDANLPPQAVRLAGDVAGRTENETDDELPPGVERAIARFVRDCEMKAARLSSEKRAAFRCLVLDYRAIEIP